MLPCNVQLSLEQHRARGHQPRSCQTSESNYGGPSTSVDSHPRVRNTVDLVQDGFELPGPTLTRMGRWSSRTYLCSWKTTHSTDPTQKRKNNLCFTPEHSYDPFLHSLHCRSVVGKKKKRERFLPKKMAGCSNPAEFVSLADQVAGVGEEQVGWMTEELKCEFSPASHCWGILACYKRAPKHTPLNP